MPSEIYNSILATLDGELTLPDDDLETAKRKMEAVHGHPIKASTDASWTHFGKTRCAVVTASNVTRRDHYLLYFRGGAFIAARGDGFLFYAEMLSALFNTTVVMADYRMAPEHRYPAALDDCCNAWLGMLDSGLPASRIGFIGDSCGGGLVLSSLLNLRDTAAPLPAFGISLCGWFDLASNTNRRDPLYHQAYCHQRGKDYAGDTPLNDPLLSPVFGDFHDLPPLLLQAGSIDPTTEQAGIIHNKTLSQGGQCRLEISDEMIHGFHGFANLGVPESESALRSAAKFADDQYDSAS